MDVLFNIIIYILNSIRRRNNTICYTVIINFFNQLYFYYLDILIIWISVGMKFVLFNFFIYLLNISIPLMFIC